jgi:(2Fe-2S) ferredoxin
MESPIAAGFRKMNLASAERHVFLCVGPDCCSEQDGLATWEVLKSEVAALRLPVMRTKAACFRICNGGPWMVVYPDGIWYGAVTPEKCKRIVTEHLFGNQPVTEWIAARHEFLPPCSRSSCESSQP